MANVKLTGIKHFEKQLLKLEKLADSSSPSSRAINNALNTGLNPIMFKARRNTPEDTGILKKSLKKKTVKTNNRSLFVRILGYAANFKMTKNKISGQVYADYSGIQEDKNKMLENAFESEKRKVFKKTIDKLAKNLNKEFAKLKVR